MIDLGAILEVEDSLRNLDENETKRLVHRFQRKQTALFVYLAAISEREELNEDEQDVLFTTALVLWMTLINSSRSPKKVKMKRIEELDNEIMLFLEKNGDADLANEARELSNHNEPKLSEYILKRCMQNDGSMQVREDSASLMVFFLKVTLDALLEVSTQSH